jgi:hypothetical protein
MFDEASSRGMLLNNLPIKDNHMVTLDAADKDREEFAREVKELHKRPSKYKSLLDPQSPAQIFRCLRRVELSDDLTRYLEAVKNGLDRIEQREVDSSFASDHSLRVVGSYNMESSTFFEN